MDAVALVVRAQPESHVSWSLPSAMRLDCAVRSVNITAVVAHASVLGRACDGQCMLPCQASRWTPR